MVTAVHTMTTVNTLQRGASVHLFLTVESCEAGRTLTCVTLSIVQLIALAPMKAGFICTGQFLGFTVWPFIASCALTSIPVLRVQALASITAELAVALLDLCVTVDPSETRQAGAGVTALASVHTSGPVCTRFVMCAVVQVLITEDPSPAFFAGALPWLCTGTMFTGRVQFTLITEQPLPALSTSALSRNCAISISFITPFKTDGFLAVFSLPSWSTGYLPVWLAGVVAKSVVSWSAYFGTSVPVVIFIADEPV